LISAVFDGASAAVVRALLDVPADATAVDGDECSALHLMRCTEAETVVPWLIAAGLDVNARDGMGRTPLLAMFYSAAPAQAFQAVLAAGADPTAVGEYDERGVGDLIDDCQRDDLEFLREAWKAAGGGDDDG
jgi:ankyrin repeat protein